MKKSPWICQPWKIKSQKTFGRNREIKYLCNGLDNPGPRTDNQHKGKEEYDFV